MSPSPSKINYFALFGLPQQFSIPLDKLETQFRLAQSTVHPDKFAQAPANEQRQALNQSMQLNEAVQTLRADTRRATHLCELNGVAVDLETNTAMRPDFLIEQMQWREDLDDAKQTARQTKSPVEFDRLCETVNEAALERIELLKTTLDVKHDYSAAVTVIRELLFIRKLANEVYDAIEALEN